MRIQFYVILDFASQAMRGHGNLILRFKLFILEYVSFCPFCLVPFIRVAIYYIWDFLVCVYWFQVGQRLMSKNGIEKVQVTKMSWKLRTSLSVRSLVNEYLFFLPGFWRKLRNDYQLSIAKSQVVKWNLVRDSNGHRD